MKQPLYRFLFSVMLYLPVTFTVWYVSAAIHLAPLTLLTDSLLHWLTPDALLWLKLDGHELLMATNFGRDAAGQIVSPPLGDDALGFSSNPLVYTYGLALLSALILATPSPEKGWRLLSGILLLMPIALFSMVMKVLKTLAFDVGMAFVQQQHWSNSSADWIAFGYQLGTLLIPMIAPLIIWVALNRAFLTQLAPQLEQAFQSPKKRSASVSH